MVPKWGKLTDCDQNISFEGGQDTSTYQISGHSSHAFSRNVCKSEIWPVSLSQNAAEMKKINRRWPKSNQFWSWPGYISMSNFRPFKMTAIKTQVSKLMNFIFDATTKTKWKGTIEKKIPQNRKLQFWPNPVLTLSKPPRGIIIQLRWGMNLTFTLHEHKTKSKLQIWKKLPKIQILKFWKKKKINMQHTFWSGLIRCVNMK